MRILLAGQKSFGLAAYEAIVDAGHDVVGVWAPPSRTLTDPLAMQAMRDGKLVFPDGRTPRYVESQRIDLIVAAHSHDFISKPVRNATKFGGIGYHPSLLPRHRGRDAVKWTVHMGDAVTGGTVYWLTDNVDGGPIAAQEHVLIPTRFASGASDADDAITSWLWRERLFPLGIQLLLDVLFDVQNGLIVEIPQDEACATWEPSWERPPLHRPDLIQIGTGIPGMFHATTPQGRRLMRKEVVS